jgi:excisionase family DNA binding protein
VRLLRPREAAEALSVSLSGIYALIDSGKIPVIPTGAGGKGYRIHPDDLAEFVRSRRKGGVPSLFVERPRPPLRHLKL